MDYCVAEGLYSDFTQEVFGINGQGKDFYQCYIDEEIRNIEINKAYEELEAGGQFAFYNLDFSEYEKQLISELEITAFNNHIINGFDGLDLQDKVSRALENLDGVQGSLEVLEVISNLISRITSTIIGVVQKILS